MVKPELGTKRVCPTCGIKFYDLMKDPIECPACDATFVAEPILPSKNDAPPPSEPEKAAIDDDEADVDSEGDVEVVSLEDVEEEGADTEDADVAAAAEIADVEIDESDSSDDASDEFLEDDDEENGDVSGIIGGVAPVTPSDS
ncbi:MAG: TIGR02300 family protein [Pseudomonadota bacterium]